MNTRVESKFSILFDSLNMIFGADLNKARIKFIGIYYSFKQSSKPLISRR